MISSETTALNDDPRAIALPAADLDQYVGACKAGSGQIFTFSRAGTTLMAATGDGAAPAQSAEARDVFFTPGQARFPQGVRARCGREGDRVLRAQGRA
jgi:hypothetical protein